MLIDIDIFPCPSLMHTSLSLSLCLTCRRSPTGPRASPAMPRWRRRSRPKLKCLRPVVSTDNRDSRPKQNNNSSNYKYYSQPYYLKQYSRYTCIYLFRYIYVYVCMYIYTQMYVDAHEINNCSSLIRKQKKNKTLQKTPSTNNSSQGFAQHLNIWTICWIISYYISIITNYIF